MTQKDSTGKRGYLKAVQGERINSAQLSSVESGQSIQFCSWSSGDFPSRVIQSEAKRGPFEVSLEMDYEPKQLI